MRTPSDFRVFEFRAGIRACPHGRRPKLRLAAAAIGCMRTTTHSRAWADQPIRHQSRDEAWIRSRSAEARLRLRDEDARRHDGNFCKYIHCTLARRSTAKEGRLGKFSWPTDRRRVTQAARHLYVQEDFGGFSSLVNQKKAGGGGVMAFQIKKAYFGIIRGA